MKMLAAVLLILAISVAPASGQTPIAIGSEFQVNTYTTYFQRSPAVAVAADGGFVVVWESPGVGGQRFDVSGVPQGSELPAIGLSPSVATDDAGNFIVVWSSFNSIGNDTDGASVQGQRYDANGDPVGGQFQVNTYTTYYQNRPSVAVDPAGNFIVVWEVSFGPKSIRARRYDSNGDPFGDDFQVDGITGAPRRGGSIGDVSVARVAVDDTGDFVVVWESYESSSTYWDIKGQRFDSGGNPQGGEFLVNSDTGPYDQRYPSVASDAAGNFVVVWTARGSKVVDPTPNVAARRFTPDGTPVANDFQVNTFTPSGQYRASVAMENDGDFVVAWQSENGDGSSDTYRSIQAQAFAYNGVKQGDEFRVNSYTTSYQVRPGISTDSEGRFVVVWQSYGSSGTDSDGTSIQAQRFATPIFADGFESGDTSAWSLSQ